MVYWNEQGGQPRWGNSEPWSKTSPKTGSPNEDSQLEEYGYSTYGNLVNVTAMLLYMIDAGFMTLEDFQQYKEKAVEAISEMLEED